MCVCVCELKRVCGRVCVYAYVCVAVAEAEAVWYVCNGQHSTNVVLCCSAHLVVLLWS